MGGMARTASGKGKPVSPDEINRAIAEWRGELKHPSPPYHLVDAEEAWPEVRDYYHDLNAVHEVVLILSTKLQREGYLWNLSMIVHDEQWYYANATAPQRCEALLRTVGKWREEP